MPIFLDDCLQVTVLGRTADGDFANVFHIDTSAGTLVPYTAAQAVLTAYCNDLLVNLCDSISVEKAHYMDLSTGGGYTGDAPPPSGLTLTGGVHVDALPPQNSYLLKLLTNSTRGERNGRTFLPGVRSDEVNERGDISSATVTVMSNAGDAFRQDLVDSGAGVLQVLHNPSGGSPSMDEVGQVFCEVPVATQRRRLNR